MRLQKRYIVWQKIHWIYVFLLGFFIGIILMNVAKQRLLIETGLLDEYVLYRMKYTIVDGKAFFWYAFGKRFWMFLLITLLSATVAGVLAVYGMFLWLGFSFGMILSAVVIRYGLKWCLLVMVGMFPQYLLYVPAYILLSKWCMDGAINPQEAGGKRIVRWITILGVVIIGLVLVCYVNPHLLFSLLKNF